MLRVNKDHIYELTDKGEKQTERSAKIIEKGETYAPSHFSEMLVTIFQQRV